MKVVWLTNILTQEISQQLNADSTVFGGWIGNSLSYMLEQNMQVVYIGPYADSRVQGIANVPFYTFSQTKMCSYDDSLKEYFKQILINEQPDIIHIWGSEYPHSLSMAQASQELGIVNKCVVSIQGLIIPYYKVYNAGLPKIVAQGKTSIRDIVKGNTILQGKIEFGKRAVYEQQLFNIVGNVIGRTHWDKKESSAINNKLKYYYCNETLREEFYNQQSWSYEKCKKHTIFLSQASYPIKGFHRLLDISKKLKKIFPDIQIRVTGKNYCQQGIGLKKYIRLDSYTKHIVRQIRKNKMQSHIEFLGSLDAKQMKEEMLNCNLFLSPSSIENSSNSIGEAMLLGVPIVASDVGGNSHIIRQNEGILYDFFNKESMLNSITKILQDSTLAQSLGENAKKHAVHTHDPMLNCQTMINIYSQIVDNK